MGVFSVGQPLAGSLNVSVKVQPPLASVGVAVGVDPDVCVGVDVGVADGVGVETGWAPTFRTSGRYTRFEPEEVVVGVGVLVNAGATDGVTVAVGVGETSLVETGVQVKVGVGEAVGETMTLAVGVEVGYTGA